MRILLTSHGYPPTISGVTLVVQKLARALVGRGHEVTVLTGSDRFEAYETTDDGVRIVRIASRKNPYWSANPVPRLPLDRFEEFVERETPDLIHAHDPLPFFLQAVRARKHNGVPLVATCHYYPSFVTSYVTHHDRSAHVVEEAVWQYAIALYNRVDRVVFATHAHRDRFVQHGLTSPARVISNGVDIARYHPGPAPGELARRYNLPTGRLVLAVGRVAKDKDLDLLIRAIAAGPAMASTHLVVAGIGPYQQVLEACARDNGVSDRVHFLGFVPEPDMPDLYRAIDTYAIVSPYEVQSLPALQAAASGIPIVAVDQGSLPEVCHHDENGLLVPPGDPGALAAALGLALDPMVNGRLGRAGRQLAISHDETVTFDLYEALYHEVRTQRVSAYSRDALASHDR